MPNIEMKAKYGNLDKARSTALRLGGTFLWKDKQIDTYFHTKNGKLKLRQSDLNGSELLPYIKTNTNGLKRSDYAKLPVTSPALVADLFRELLGQKSEIRKVREVYLIGNVRVHLDAVEELGNFLEFEAVFEEDSPSVQAVELKKVIGLMQEFGVGTRDLIDGSYPELLAKKSGPNSAQPGGAELTTA